MLKTPVFALVDCDNFFVSCERVFRPDLWHKPVAVLSNNDSCIVARSREVRALGVPMGVPLFKVRDIFEKHNIIRFSANFGLYGDFSQRVVKMLEATAPHVEVYSVDESFLEISSLEIADYTEWAQELRQKIGQWLGIPVSIGIAPTKTLAKAAAEHAKHTPVLEGVFSLQHDVRYNEHFMVQRREQLLQNLPVEEVWGIGWRTAPKLRNRGIKTAADLACTSDAWAKQQLTIRGLHTVKELRGEQCFGVEDIAKPQQTLAVTRTFPHSIRPYHQMESSVATYAAKAAQKIRRSGQVAGALALFVAGDRHRDGDNYRRVSTVLPLLQPTNDTGVLIKTALQALEKLYDPDFAYRRAGVILLQLASEESQQLSWLSPHSIDELDRRQQLMQTMDAINDKYHTRLVRHAVEQPIQFHKGDQRSAAYTTQWHMLPKVHV